ncbi:MAG: PSD1 domain-containing protein [Planctomycetia bacterium]|nr:PSD1 domain-containing protein [Planctomycetia bacterium]
MRCLPLSRILRFAAAGSALFLAAALANGQSPPEAEGLELFEKKIRPVLVEHCYKCHSAKATELQGNLRLDFRDGMRKGGDRGPAVVPKMPGASVILKALTHDELEMPPDRKLPAAVAADFERWIKLGAPDPRDQSDALSSQPPAYDFAATRKHWSYQPIRKPPPPPVKDNSWPAGPIDAFVLARLEAAGLSPSPPAERKTLIRRAYFDLVGLPPTLAEIESFESDASPDAFARVVDRLLASPHYGERWGRHWLDVARYADTKDGVLMYGDDRVRPYAYTYRDYVVRVINDDLPFDRFVEEQLAADLIEPKVEPWRLSALGYLTLGRMFDNNVHDVIDDRIDVVSRGLLGLTVACARCHNHKYDAIPTADYYSLYGVFASCEQPLELPLVAAPESVAGGTEFEAQAAPKRADLQKMLDEQYALLSEQARVRVGDYLAHVVTRPPDPLETAIYFLSLAPDDLRPPIVARWRRYLAQHATADDPVFGPWHDLLQIDESDGAKFSEAATAILEKRKSRAAGVAPGQINPLVRDALASATLASKADVARAYGDLLKKVYEESKKPPDGATGTASPDSPPLPKEGPGGSASDSPPLPKGGPGGVASVDRSAREQLLSLVTSRDSPAYFPKSQTRRYMSRADTDAFGGKVQEIDRMAVKSPAAPPRAMVLVDAPELYDPRVFVRGNPVNLGDRVPRQFLQIVGGDARQPFSQGSGRLDLARAITSPENPLTARVLVNRVWMHHFGEPLVPTPSDFGTRSAPPSHPELLDYLAATFREEGWSLKKLHRRILLSTAWQQVSLDRPDARKIDPDNRLLWRMNRRRLDLEAMRDSLLAVSGRLDRTLFGRPVDIVGSPQTSRRTLYGLVDRQSLPAMYRAFDFAVPDTSVERRPMTTVPQQALFGMNSPLVIEQAKAIANRPEIAPISSDIGRINMLYRLVLARDPAADELDRARSFVAAIQTARDDAEKSQLSAWELLAQVLLLTNERMFVD